MYPWRKKKKGMSAPNDLSSKTPLDDDDKLARIDISSLYAVKDGEGAQISVPVPGGTAADPQNVRVKYNHGHISVRTAISEDAMLSLDDFDQPISLVDLGGVNGSCDVSVEREGIIEGCSVNQQEEEKKEEEKKRMSVEGNSRKTHPIAAKIHVDSFSPESVSIVTVEGGDIDVTLDRKVEADVRLLSCWHSLGPIDSKAILDDDEAEFIDSLKRHDIEWGD